MRAFAERDLAPANLLHLAGLVAIGIGCLVLTTLAMCFLEAFAIVRPFSDHIPVVFAP